ncbi:Uncharacterised protein family UPF0316 [Moorella glycerini]|uniref:UPF0316 protein MOST_04990 n=1 Tax=Neomoorella stamsii TaxID=1266720 RepID=A0A9X7J5B7_9FIRM|nr:MULTISPECIES: DUF2179 domain-containing protein [Moorella]PRR76338.1 hypothetical protein MOST_04990 [Moorella stamsii]CEP67094.1 Uncharacterised protein family UPF0316 [Moorella glycerini]
MLALMGGYFLIFLARVTDVSLATLRMLLLVRGKRFYAAGIGIFEVTIYVVALKYVVDRLNDPASLVFYAMGFATGNIVGSLIEEKVALGQVTVQVITLHNPLELAETLRAAGFGVTITEGQGRDGSHPILNLSFPRRQLNTIQQMVNNWDPEAFVVVHEARTTHGGFCRYRSKGK